MGLLAHDLRRARLTGAVVCLLAWSAGVHAASLSGEIVLVDGKGKTLPASEAQHGVVYFVPSAGAAARPPADTHDLLTRDKQFFPRVLPVGVGSTVRFPNEDPILHNVFSVSSPNAFDVGLYGPGEGRSHTFRAAGLVRVFCNVHHAMVAYIVVLDTPHFARPGADGTFRLTGLPDGPGRLTVWQERTEGWSEDVVLPAGRPLEVRLEVTQRRVPRHLDKSGRPYQRSRRDRYTD